MPQLVRPNLVRFTLEEVAPRVRPRNKLSARSYSFEFDDYGNLLESDCPASERGTGYSQLLSEARQFWDDQQIPD